MRIRYFITLMVGIVTAVAADGKVVLPEIYSDNMVVQQQAEAMFHGKATPGSIVTIRATWQKKPLAVKTDSNGDWEAKIPTPKGSRKSYRITFADSVDQEVLTLENVKVGEVWLCSGQSNMEMPVDGSWAKVKDFEKEKEAARNYPDVRLLKVKRHTKMRPQMEAIIENGGWMVSAPETVADFSAIAGFFGREINDALDVPVGVIECCWGGSPVEAWLSYETLSKANGFEGVVKDFIREGMDEPAIRAHYKELVDSAKAGRNLLPPVPADAYLHRSGFPGTVDGHTFYPGELYNAMLLPMTRMTVRGILWYQGENNGDRGPQYECLFPTMIQEWRGLWTNEDMPFYFVQLANWHERKAVEPHANWGRLREAQAQALHLNNTGMAVAIDVGEADDIHPRNKQEVARRLALLALNHTYGKKVISEAPAFKNYEIKGNKCYLTFTAPADRFAPDGNLEGFTVAGAAGRFYKAEARREGNRIVVSAPEVSVPVAVRYAWADNPPISLYGENGLPVAPFRTDRW